MGEELLKFEYPLSVTYEEARDLKLNLSCMYFSTYKKYKNVYTVVAKPERQITWCKSENRLYRLRTGFCGGVGNTVRNESSSFV
jgi:hypothetical protein